MSGSFNTQPSSGIPPNPTIVVKDSQFTVTDQTDTTKSMQFEVSGITTGTQRSYTMPNASGIIPMLSLSSAWNSVQTFQDNGFLIRGNADPTAQFKFDNSLISAGSIRTLFCPDGGGVIGTLGNVQVWTGLQTFNDGNWRMRASADSTKTFIFDASGISSGVQRTYTLPNASGNLTLSGSSQTWTGTQTFNDSFFLVQNTADNTKKFVFDASAILPGGTRTLTIQDVSGTVALLNALQTWTIGQVFVDNAFTIADNGDQTKKVVFEASDITTGTTRTLTVPNANTTLVGKDTTDNLTNKTLTTPIIDTATHITTTGFLYVHNTVATAANAVLEVTNNTSTEGTVFTLNDTAGGAGNQVNTQIFRNGSAVGSISTTNVATLYNTTSDYRLKTEITPISNPIELVTMLRPGFGAYKKYPDQIIGMFYAHEVQEICPQAVCGKKDEVDKDGNPVFQTIDHSQLIPLLTAAIQESIVQIASLGKRLSALEVVK